MKIHGVTRREGKGVPKIIQQFEANDEKQLEMVRNTIKVAVLEGDAAIDDLVAILYYNSKPVYFLLTVVPDVSWKSCSKHIYSKLENKKVTKTFLRPNFVDLYNYDMNSVVRTDHVRMSYNMGE